MNDTPLHDQDLEDEINRTGNAPMIPRQQIIEVLGQVQLLQTKLLIILNQYEPEHFNESTSKRNDQTIPDSVRTSDSSGHPEQPVVYTLT